MKTKSYGNFIIFMLLGLMIKPLSAQSKSESNQTIIKTNILNIPLIPSLHLERQVTNKISLQANFHRASFVFINQTDLLNASIDARYYFKKQEEAKLKGFFASLGVGINHRYNTGRWIDSNYISSGFSKLGLPQTKLGYQYQSANKRFVFDTSIGLVLFPIALQRNDLFYVEYEYRANIGVGWRL
jgi:hypothetical protein